MHISHLADADLILASNVRDRLDDPRDLSRAADRGLLFQLRRGAYVDLQRWQELTPRERHVLRVRAVSAASGKPTTIAGISAAAVWGAPIYGPWPDEVTVLDRWRGGGRSDPGVRRTAAGFDSAMAQVVDRIQVTSLARTIAFIAARYPLEQAIGSIDWAISSRCVARTSASLVMQDIARMPGSPGFRRALRAVAFADAASGSFGESQARAVIHLLGFEPPQLQRRFEDVEGEMFCDYYWRSVNVSGEFDGKVKFTREQFSENDPAGVAWREKRREDRLRRFVSTVVRITTQDVEQPARLRRLLLGAGVPMASGG